MHLACMGQYESAIKLLVLQPGIDINKRNSAELFPMHYACKYSLHDSIRLLVARGANIYSDREQHPIDMLPTSDEGFIRELIALQGSVLVTPDISFIAAVQSGHLATVVKYLNSGSPAGLEVLTVAVSQCKKAVAQLLISHMEDNEVSAATPAVAKVLLRWAVEDGLRELIERLLKAKPDLNASLTSNNDTALHIACSCGQFRVVSLLLEHGSSIDMENNDNKQPFSCFPQGARSLFFGETIFPENLLFSNDCSFWFYLVQITNSDVPGISERVKDFAKQYPQLVYVKDKNEHKPENVASTECCHAIRDTYLWHGRYRPDPDPAHVSATCFVYRCVDEMDIDRLGMPSKVAVKLMRRRDQWQREVDIRELIKGSSCVLEHIRIYPAKEELSVIEMEEVRNKEDAERMYAIVMPLAGQDMFDAIKHDSWAGKDGLVKAKQYFAEVARAVDELHKQRVLHADVKSLNLVRLNRWLLIDMDASCKIGVDNVGFKSSTAIMPPEAFYKAPDGSDVVVRSEESWNKYKCELVRAEPSFDVWSLGVLLYQISNTDAVELFKSNKRDNLSTERNAEDSVWELEAWSDETKGAKLSKVADLQMRNLLSLMLSKEPTKRPTIERVLAHPALSGKSAARPGGATPKWDVFISYRDSSDRLVADKLFDVLEARGLHVWRDKARLKAGDKWEEEFTSALTDSRVFLCVLSQGAVSNYPQLTAASDCDNVLLEHRMALELLTMGYMDKIVPVLVGSRDAAAGAYSDFFAPASRPDVTRMPDLSVAQVDEKLRLHMERECLGSPLRPQLSVKATYNEIMASNGKQLLGEEGAAVSAVADAVVDIIQPKRDFPAGLSTCPRCGK